MLTLLLIWLLLQCPQRAHLPIHSFSILSVYETWDAFMEFGMRFAHSGCASRIRDAPVAFGTARFASLRSTNGARFARVDINSEISWPILRGGGGGPDRLACNPKFVKNYNDLSGPFLATANEFPNAVECK